MSREKLMQLNKVNSLKGKPDKVRIAELEKENADLKEQLAEVTDGLIEIADIVAGGE